MSGSVVFEHVIVRGFRSMERVEFAPSRRVNAIVGGNGEGKTSLLEALYFVATSRSFRTDRAGEMVGENGGEASVRARLHDGLERWEQRAGVSWRDRALAVDGAAPRSVAEFAVRAPVVVFHPGDVGLVSGGALARRRLLDRLALFSEPASGAERGRFGRAARERQQLLWQKGVQARELSGYEQVMAESGARLTGARRRAAEAIGVEAAKRFGQVGRGTEQLQTRYVAGGSEDPAEFLRMLGAARTTDARRRGASYGPQRDELEIHLGGRCVRRLGSQGQQRLVALALKLAELECVREARGGMPVLLLDDVWSELDRERERAVGSYLLAGGGQVFVTGTREMMEGEGRGDGQVQQWTMKGGALGWRGR